MTDPEWGPKPGPIRSRAGAHVPRKGDLGLRSSGQQGHCLALTLAAVGPGDWICQRRVSAVLSAATATPLTASITWRSLAPGLPYQGGLWEPRGQDEVC